MDLYSDILVKDHARVPAASPVLSRGIGGVASPPLRDDRVVAAGGDGDFVAGAGLVEQLAAERNVVDADWSSGLFGGEEEFWDVLLERHVYWLDRLD